MDEKDWGREEGGQPAVEPQFEDAPVEEEANQEEVMVESVAEEAMERSVVGEPLAEHDGHEATIGPGSQDVVQIHAGRGRPYNKRIPLHMQPHQEKTNAQVWRNSPPECSSLQYAYFIKCRGMNNTLHLLTHILRSCPNTKNYVCKILY